MTTRSPAPYSASPKRAILERALPKTFIARPGRRRLAGSLAVLFAALLAMTGSAGAQDAGLEQLGSEPHIGLDLMEPDGAAFDISGDGEWALFGLGTAVYESGGDLSAAYQAAEFDAKQNIRRFLNLTATDAADVSELVEKSGYLKADPTIFPPQVIQSINRTLANQPAEIVERLEVIERRQVPLDSGSGGTVQVRVGVSSGALGQSVQPPVDETF